MEALSNLDFDGQPAAVTRSGQTRSHVRVAIDFIMDKPSKVIGELEYDEDGSTPDRITVNSDKACSELRQHPRYDVVVPLIAIPVRDDGSLHWSERRIGRVVNASTGGLGFRLENCGDQVAPNLLVGIDQSGQQSFAGLNLRFREQRGDRSVGIGAAFGGPAEKILNQPIITEQFDANTLTLTPPIPDRILMEWVKAGVLERQLYDRVQLCPRCSGLPTFRQGCRKCGSAHLGRDKLIHHFACAHVAPIQDFQQPDGLVCPKCFVGRLVVGADFEYRFGQYVCYHCKWQDAGMENVGHCLRCNTRFAGREAQVQDVYAYRPRRLNWKYR